MTEHDFVYDIGIDTDPMATDLRELGDAFHSAADEIDDESDGHDYELSDSQSESVQRRSSQTNYEPSTPQESFRALVWGAVMSGEEDFLTKKEMSQALVEIADTVYPIHKWDDNLKQVDGSYMGSTDE